jgi:hypothetical protein
MASTYSPLKIELIGTGEQVATWGQTTNTNLGTALEQAIGGKADVTMSSTTETLTLADTNAAQNARALYLNLTGTPGGAATLNVPAVQKAYIVRNATTGGFAVTVKVSGQTGVSVPNGATMHLYNNGTDVVNALTNLPSGATIGGSPISTSSGTVSSVAAGNGMNFSTITSTGSVTLGTPSTLNTTTTNLVSGSTHTHAITTASASTASTIVARDSLGGFEATTISMTTGNIGTLNVGTQTNKATISYTTNAARTLTVPAVSGNRTFAFLEEAQTFTAAQTYNANQTIAANLIFSGNARRIQGKFDNYTNDAVVFQDSTTDGTTTINVAPNGAGAASAVHINSSSDLTNSIVGALFVDSNEFSIFSLYSGSNSFQPLNLVNGGNIYLQVNSDGTVYMAGVFGSTVGGTNRDLYIDDTGKLGYLSSTRKSKTNIVPIEDTSWLMNLEPVSFNRRVQASGGLYTDQAHKNTEFGLIADDAAQVRPEICFNDDFGNLAGIHYEQLIAPMLKEIQKLRAEVEALKAKG